uniref:Uncharacterized protein n=1 Tax=Meleagris gallopavo TaxID=9103 RepID=G3USB1_MELGA
MASNGVFDSFASYSSTFLRGEKTQVPSNGSADGSVGLKLNRMGQSDPKPIPTEEAEQQML